MSRRTLPPSGMVYAADQSGVVHLADESSLGGLISGCDLFGEVRVVEPVPDADLCLECWKDLMGLLP